MADRKLVTSAKFNFGFVNNGSTPLTLTAPEMVPHAGHLSGPFDNEGLTNDIARD